MDVSPPDAGDDGTPVTRMQPRPNDPWSRVMNAYLKAKQDQYDKIRTDISGLQTRAVEEKRELTEDELRSITEQAEQARTLAADITALVEIENRNAAVAKLAASLPQDAAAAAAAGTDKAGETVGADQTRTSSTSAVDRDPGHYRSVTQGGEHSFFGDMMRAKESDDDAKKRLTEHHRALTSSSAGTGILPPKWLTEEYAAIARQTRRVAAAVRQIPIQDARPITLPKQTAPTTVAAQAAEGNPTSFTDAFNSGVDTVPVKAVVGGQKVARQLLDGSSPAVDQLIYGDLIGAYNSNVEVLVVAAMIASAGAATTTYATEAAYTTAVTPTATGVPFIKALRGAATAVRNARKLPADMVVASVSRYGSWLDITDTQGRPLIPVAEYNPMNAVGMGAPANDGMVLGMPVYASDGITQYPESILAARSQDTILFESPTLRFRYEEPDGPEIIRLGVWGYVGVFTRYAGASVKQLSITAA